ncbi:MAG: HAD family hydrolase [Halobacteriales archaeon]
MSIAGVGFDLDHTLCVTEPDRASLLADAAESVDAPGIAEWMSRPAYREAHRANLTSDTRTPVFETLLEETDFEVEPAALAAAYRRAVNDALQPLPGLEALIEELREDYRVGLLTNGPVRAQRSKLERLSLRAAFDAVLISGDLPAGKPDPRAFAALIDALGVTAETLVYVGNDVTADIGGATNAGCRAIQVLHEDGPDPNHLAAAHVRYEDLPEALPGLIAGLE